MVGGEDLQDLDQSSLNICVEYDLHIDPVSYHEEGGEDTEEDDGEVGGEPVGEGELSHVRKILHEITYAVAEDSGENSDEGEEDNGPFGDVDEEEVVDMDTTLGGKDKIQQEDEADDAERQSWFEW